MGIRGQLGLATAAALCLAACGGSPIASHTAKPAFGSASWEVAFTDAMVAFYPRAARDPERYLGFGYDFCGHIRLFPADAVISRGIAWTVKYQLFEYEDAAAEGIVRAAEAYLCPHGVHHPEEDLHY